MPRSRDSQRWLKAHFNDPFVREAQRRGLRSRAAFKLAEIDQRDHLLRPGQTVVDLGADQPVRWEVTEGDRGPARVGTRAWPAIS